MKWYQIGVLVISFSQLFKLSKYWRDPLTLFIAGSTKNGISDIMNSIVYLRSTLVGALPCGWKRTRRLRWHVLATSTKHVYFCNKIVVKVPNKNQKGGDPVRCPLYLLPHLFFWFANYWDIAVELTSPLDRCISSRKQISILPSAFGSFVTPNPF